MAIQFPPIAPGDPEPNNGDTFLYLVTGEEFLCRRQSLFEAAQWAAVGTFQDSTFQYMGTLEIQEPAPSPDLGNIFSVVDGGIAHPTFNGLAGQEINQWSLVIFADPQWVLVSAAATSPWVRTVSGRIQPLVQTDDLDMVDGNYMLEELTLLGPSLEEPEPESTEVEGLSGLFGEHFGLDENVQNVCNACNGNPDTFATASNQFNVIHVMHEDDTPVIEVTESVEVKILPEHWLLVQFIGNPNAVSVQADANGIATITGVSGPLEMYRISANPPEPPEDFVPLPANTPMELYYLKADGNYLVDPDC